MTYHPSVLDQQIAYKLKLSWVGTMSTILVHCKPSLVTLNQGPLQTVPVLLYIVYTIVRRLRNGIIRSYKSEKNG
jgi:hypothetical protein